MMGRKSMEDAPDAPRPGLTTTVLFDGRCGFCTLTVEWVVRRLAQPTAMVPWQKTVPEDYGLREDDLRRAVWWCHASGQREGGHRAVGRVLLACRRPWPLLGRLLLLPAPVAWLASLGYAIVARLRGHLPAVTPACDQPRSWDAARERPCRASLSRR